MYSKIFCIIPAYNEERYICQVVRKVKSIVSEIIVVDDNSHDNTKQLAAKAGAIVISHIINRGQGAALETGNEYALKNGADIIVHFDADGQFLAQEISDLIDPIIKGEADVVLGSRFLEKKSNIPFFKKNIILPIARFASKIFFGIKFSDPQSGFRALNRKAAEILKIEQDRMAHCSEILIKIKKSNLIYKEIPITVIYHSFGQRFNGGLKILKELFLGKLVN